MLRDEEVRKLVRNAYVEGFGEGMNEYQKPRTGGKTWEQSKAYRAMLSALKENADNGKA